MNVSIVVFDLDGTLADCEHRRHLVDKSRIDRPPDYAEFDRRCKDDTPIGPVVDVFRAMFDALGNDGRLQIWSGRGAAARADTQEWLIKNISSEVFWPLVLTNMRPIGDSTPDEKLKESWLDNEMQRGNAVRLVFDDREKVVAMWRRRGIICAQVAPGRF